jgi:hypothetical protein
MVADGGPAYSPPRIFLTGFGFTMYFGNLITNVSPTGLYSENLNPLSNIYWGAPESCQLVNALWADGNSLNNLVPYIPVAPRTKLVQQQ